MQNPEAESQTVEITIHASQASAVSSLRVAAGESVQQGQVIAVFEAMKMQTELCAPAEGVIKSVLVKLGDAVQAQQPVCIFQPKHTSPEHLAQVKDAVTAQAQRADLKETLARLAASTDEVKQTATEKRHAKGYRTARENLHHLCDADSFIEYGQFALAAQRSRRSKADLIANTSGDGIITGTANINGELFSNTRSRTGIIINDYSVLAGTQGYFHHNKLDRILELAAEQHLPLIMYTEGGGGRPGDTDVQTQIAGLHFTSFRLWAALKGKVPRISVNNGYCFAGNAALFGSADIRIATRASNIGMAGPAMIEGGGLGQFSPSEIGPVEVQTKNGVIDLLAEDEAEATELAKKVLSYWQGDLPEWQAEDQLALRDSLPLDRRFAYDINTIISRIADTNSVTELRKDSGTGLVTAFIRIEGKALGLIANNSRSLGGAIDSAAADKATWFFELCQRWQLPMVSLCDTPGFMVGPESESEAAVSRMSSMFSAGAQLETPLVAIFLRKAYGLGAMAMCGGDFHRPVYSASWPSGEFGGMGLEGAVNLGFKKELDAAESEEERQALFDQLLAAAYESGKATETASFLEIDAVIDPIDTRKVIKLALNS